MLRGGLHDALFTQFLLPVPSTAHGVFNGHLSFPAQHLISFLWIGPNLHNVALTSSHNFVWHFHACCSFKCIEQLQHREPLACANVEDFKTIGFVLIEHAFECNHMGLGKVYNVDKVANARPVGSGIVVAKYTQLFAQANSRLG